MSELTEAVSDRAVAVSSWRSDTTALTLRALIWACAVAGVITTIDGLQQAWAQGVPADGSFGRIPQEIWGITPYVLLVVISMLHVSKRSLSTLLVTTLLAWFMSTGYGNLDEMGLVVMVIPMIQLAFVAGALGVMFTFWLLRRRKA